MIKSIGDHALPKNLRPHLQLTCEGKMETELKNCIEDVLLAFDNVVVNTSHQVQQESVLTQYGLIHIIKPDKGTIQFVFQDTLEINLKPGMKYFVQVVDTKYTLMTVNPKVVPGKKFQLSENSGLFLVYFDVGDLSSGRGFFRDLQ